MKRRIMKLSLIVLALALLCVVVPPPRVQATFPGVNGRITFQADTGSGNQIYTVRPDGHDLRQVTHVNGEAKAPDWSPDGRHIVFEHDQSTADVCADIAIMNADGSDLVDLLQPPNICDVEPSFTPDGNRIVFERFNIDTGDDAIWSMNVDGTDRRRITSGPPCCGVTDPNVSPDGQTLSFVGFNGLDFGEALFTSGIDGSNLFQLTPFTIDLAIKQDWAPDGEHLVVGTNANFFPPGASPNIATIHPDGTGLRYLTHYQGGDVNAFVGSYSPDGRWIVFRLEDHGSFGLFRMRSDGSDLHVILGFSNFKPRLIDWGPRSLGGAKDEDNQN
jgi:Tol biopolymer transport system component